MEENMDRVEFISVGKRSKAPIPPPTPKKPSKFITRRTKFYTLPILYDDSGDLRCYLLDIISAVNMENIPLAEVELIIEEAETDNQDWPNYHDYVLHLFRVEEHIEDEFFKDKYQLYEAEMQKYEEKLKDYLLLYNKWEQDNEAHTKKTELIKMLSNLSQDKIDELLGIIVPTNKIT